MEPESKYKHLGPKPGSFYKQLYVKGRRIRAENLYELTLGPDAWTPEQVAYDYDLPIEVVLEAIEYCKENEDLLQEERDREIVNLRAAGLLPPETNGQE